jgi:hypothetical protein
MTTELTEEDCASALIDLAGCLFTSVKLIAELSGKELGATFDLVLSEYEELICSDEELAKTGVQIVLRSFLVQEDADA